MGSRLRQITPDQMPEVLQRAQELLRRETEHGEVEQTAAAAEELGVPRAYLERAADELLRDRERESRLSERQGRLHRRNKTALISTGIALAISLTLALSLVTVREGPSTAPTPPAQTAIEEIAPPPAPVVVQPPPPPGGPFFEAFGRDASSRWRLSAPGEARVRVRFDPEGGLRVTGYAVPGGAWRLTRVQGPPALGSRGSLGVTAGATPGGDLRLLLYGAGGERWVSGRVHLGAEASHRLALDQMEYQHRSGSGSWTPGQYRPPDFVDSLTVELTPPSGRGGPVEFRLRSLEVGP